MSNVGQQILGIAGAIIGGIYGGPAGAQAGYLLGSLAGGYIFAQQTTTRGPHITDQQVQASTIGVDIQRNWGTNEIKGNVIWATPYEEVSHTASAGRTKGGASSQYETYTAKVSFALGLCRGVQGGFLRVKMNKKVVYDRGPQRDDEDDEAFQMRIDQADTFDAKNTFYPGNKTQMPDPTIEAFVGIGNCSAYRDLCYMVFPDFDCADYYNIIPEIEVEVYSVGTIACHEVIEYSNRVGFEWLDADDPTGCNGDYTYTVVQAGAYDQIAMATFLGDPPTETYSFDDLQEAKDFASQFSALPIGSFYQGHARASGTKTTRAGGNSAFSNNSQFAYMYWTPYGASLGEDPANPGGSNCAKLESFIPENGQTAFYTVVPDGVLFGAAIVGRVADGSGTPDGWDLRINCSGHDFLVAYGLILQVQRVSRLPPNPCFPRCAAPLPVDPAYAGYCYEEDLLTGHRTYYESANWEDHLVNMLQTGILGGVNARPFLNPVLDPLDPLNTQEYWEPKYNEAVANGYMAPGGVYGVDYPVTASGARLVINVCTADGGKVTVGSIVQEICAEVGLTDVDVSDLTELISYIQPRCAPARAIIDPLRFYSFFDAVEDGRTYRFVKRGKPTVATIPESDMRAFEEGGEMPPAYENPRKMEFDLPRTVRVKYRSREREYEQSQQKADRLLGGSVQPLDIDIPAEMSHAKAAQIAEILLRDLWTSRRMFTFQLPRRWLRLLPTDCINIPYRGTLLRVRIVVIDFRIRGVLGITAVADNEDGYVSFATGATPEDVRPEMPLFGSTYGVLLDIPLVNDGDNDPGYVFAARRDGGNTWRGATLVRSQDNGDSYDAVGAVTRQAVMGRIVSAVPAGPTDTWDAGTEILIDLDSGQVETRSIDAVLQGANMFAFGADGRWELAQFRTVTLVTGNRFKLTNLLRGRRGTEHLVGTSQAGDDFVLLYRGVGLIRIPMEISSINVAKPHKILTGDEPIDAPEMFPFTGRAMALRPFSPVMITGERDTSGNLEIQWTRRGRIGQELPDGSDIPLSEETERYRVYIIADSAILRTFDVTEPRVEYSAADQTTDGVTLFDPVLVRVRQVSAIVGDGTPGEATI